MVAWIRRARLVMPAVAIAFVAAGCVNFTGSKVVTNGESSGPFVVRITCEDTDPETQDLTFNGEGTESTENFELPIDFENFQASTTCTITEIEQAGATSVTYVCGDITFGPPAELAARGPGMNVARGENPGEATCTETPDGLIVEVTLFVEVEVSVSFTVINDFETPPPPPTPTAAPAEAVADPVPAQVVAFTG